MEISQEYETESITRVLYTSIPRSGNILLENAGKIGKLLHEHHHIDWMITSGIAAVVAFLDIYFISEAMENQSKISFYLAAIGIATFFGVLIISSFHAVTNKQSKGTMRKAIASTIIIVYISAFALITFGESTNLSINSDLNDNTILEHFSNVVMVVIGFYFGTKGVREFIEKWKNNDKKTKTNSDNESNSDKGGA